MDNLNKIQDDILSYRGMCDAENVQTLQRGMNFRMNPKYSVILMSQRSSAPYKDKIHEDGITIEYEGHDVSKKSHDQSHNPKVEDQREKLPSGKLAQNGYFIKAVKEFKEGESLPELVKVYEKVFPGVWSLKGFFDLIDCKVIHDGRRNVFRYLLRLSDRSGVANITSAIIEHTRLIPSEVKREVWKRDQGRCVMCGDTKNLHFDHDLPFSKGGTSLSTKNVRLLCMKHNLQKSDKIE
ncbi:MAG: HNH endonuclease signature motif containing protein [Patescibacteria group bacterium]